MLKYKYKKLIISKGGNKMLKEKLIKKAKNNNWEIVENYGGGVNITIPWKSWSKIYKILSKSNYLSYKWRCTWDYEDVILSIF